MDPAPRRLAALAALGALLFFSPLPGAFNRPDAALGVPLLPAYLYLAWGGLVLAARVLGSGGKRS